MRIKTINVEELPIINIAPNSNFSIASKNITEYTHGFFKYPCKFIPHIPRWAIQRYSPGKNGAVLDPFCGSGTTLVESVLAGKLALGIDFDPFSRLLSKVKSTPLSKNQLERLKTELPRLIDQMKRDPESVKLPEIPNTNLWFSKENLKNFAKVKLVIERFWEELRDDDIRDILFITLASIVRKISYADHQSPKPYVSRKIRKIPMPVIPTFENAVYRNLEKIEKFSFAAKGPRSKIIGTDARDINVRVIKKVSPTGVSIAITSPPYINAFDVVRSLKLENFCIGLIKEDELREYKRKQIGTEFFSASEYAELPNIEDRKLNNTIKKIYSRDKRRAYVVFKFFEDMRLNFQGIYNALNDNGVYCVVIGDSEIRGVKVPTHEILVNIGLETGFKLETIFSYDIKNHYLRIPRKGRGGFIKRDWVIALEK